MFSPEPKRSPRAAEGRFINPTIRIDNASAIAPKRQEAWRRCPTWKLRPLVGGEERGVGDNAFHE